MDVAFRDRIVLLLTNGLSDQTAARLSPAVTMEPVERRDGGSPTRGIALGTRDTDHLGRGPQRNMSVGKPHRGRGVLPRDMLLSWTIGWSAVKA